MAWIRLDDDYIYHPKFKALSHHAFRLWHEGMAYCRKLLTDGLIPKTALKTFQYAKPSSVKELTNSIGKLAPLWEPHEVGFKVHDYLDWNAGYEEEQIERDAAKLRMRAFRGRRRSDRLVVTPDVTPPVTRNVTPIVTPLVTPSVPGEGKGKVFRSEKNSEQELAERAGRLREELYPAWYAKHRNGARLRLVANSLEYQDAMSLVRLWDNARLEKLAAIVLTTDDAYIASTDRSFRIFAMKASWADDRLSEWEANNSRTA